MLQMIPNCPKGLLVTKVVLMTANARRLSVSKQAVQVTVASEKTLVRIMLVVARGISRPTAEAFPEKANLLDQNHTGKPSHRSTSNARATHAGNQPHNSGGHRILPRSSKLDHAQGTNCDVNVRGVH